MEFPDDVLSLIREYSRPLKRRTISSFWVEQKINNIDKMIERVKEIFIDNFFYDEYPVPIPNCDTFGINTIWIIGLGDYCAIFKEKDLFEWVGDFEFLRCGSAYDEYGLEKDDIMYKQFYNDTQVVKEKLI
jgi:hypothetical protein